MGQCCALPVPRRKISLTYETNGNGDKTKLSMEEISPSMEQTNHTNSNDYVTLLKQCLDNIFRKSGVNTEKLLISKAIPKRPISPNVNYETSPKIIKLDSDDNNIHFFTDFYSIEDLQTFLDSCSSANSTANSDSSPLSLLESEEESVTRSLQEKVFLGTVKDIETLTEAEVTVLLKDNKIHIKLAENKEYVNKLIALLKRAAKFHILTDFLDLPNEENNPAISVAVLNHNIEAFFYLIKTYKAHVPLFIYEQEEKTPFLIYLAKHGKIPNNSSPNSQIDYLLVRVLKQMIDNYEDGILPYLCEIDQNSKLSLPHFLLRIYGKSVELRSHIVECFKLCITACPKCAEIMCPNYYDPRYCFNVLASAISHPDIDLETNEEFMRILKKTLNDKEDDRELLGQLIHGLLFYHVILFVKYKRNSLLHLQKLYKSKIT